jgi:hypothetical protein
MTARKSFALEFKYGTSRGRDTYGYNLVSLYVDGKRVSRQCGGGYDMQGAALGQWITEQFQTELVAIARERAHRMVFVDAQGKWVGGKQEHRSGEPYLYGFEAAFLDGPAGAVHHAWCDGACGWESMRSILRALSYEIRKVAGDVYTVDEVRK